MDFQGCLTALSQIVGIVVGLITIVKVFRNYLFRRNTFQEGGVYQAHGKIADVLRNSYAAKRLGKPISEEQPAAPSKLGTTGTLQRFQGNRDGTKVWDAVRNANIIGVSVYNSHYAACPVWGEIGRCYEKLGGTTSRLGFPISWEIQAAPSRYGTTGKVQRFEGEGDGVRMWHEPRKDYITAVSIYSSNRGTYPVWGSIGQCFENKENKGTTGRLGFPISKEEEMASSPRTVRQRFEGGSIISVYGQAPTVQTK